MLAMAAGADFIKTSTGKIGADATLPVALCMLEAVRDFHDQTGRDVGVKVAGGIRTSKQAIQYLVLVQGDARRHVDAPRAVPDRRLEPAERRVDAAREGADRPLRTARPLHDRLRSHRGRPDRADRATQQTAHVRSTRRAPESTDIVRLEDRYGLFIDGEFVEPQERRWFTTINPATEEPLAEVAEAGPEDVDARGRGRPRGVRTRWQDLPGSERGEVPVPHRARAAGARARVRRARDDGRRQADQGIARRRPAAGRRALLLLRGLGRQARVRVPRRARRARSASPARSSRGTSRC